MTQPLRDYSNQEMSLSLCAQCLVHIKNSLTSTILLTVPFSFFPPDSRHFLFLVCDGSCDSSAVLKGSPRG